MEPKRGKSGSGASIPTLEPLAHDVQEELVGKVLGGRYKVQGVLGRGGMGIVYRCRDSVTGVVYAMKSLPPEIARSSEELEVLRRNFRLVGALAHRNIAAMRNIEVCDGRAYLLMDCVDGTSLRIWACNHAGRDGALPLPTVLPVVRQIAEALDYAHGEGVRGRMWCPP